MYSAHEADLLYLPSLPLAPRRVHIVPALQTSSLLSMGQLCDADCCVTFDATSVHVHLNDRLLLTGTRAHPTELWHLDLIADIASPTNAASEELTAPSPWSGPASLHHSYNVSHTATPTKLVAFAHTALFSPALSTLTTALGRDFLSAYMGLTAQTLQKHPPQSVAMV